jgi:hypothetical protein
MPNTSYHLYFYHERGMQHKEQNKANKGLFGSVAIHSMERDIHFFSGYPTCGSLYLRDRGNHIPPSMPSNVVEFVPQKVQDVNSQFWLVFSSPP